MKTINKNESKDILITKPLLKWVGGKTQILSQVLEQFPKQIDNYYEPFLGGGSVLLGLLEYVNAGKIQIKGKIYASDFNKRLIGLYKNIQSKPQELLNKLTEIIDLFKKCKNNIKEKERRKVGTIKNLEQGMETRESYYYWIRQKYNEITDLENIDCSAMLIFLNKTGFRGVYRESKNGYNVPYGFYDNPEIINKDHLMKINQLIKNVVFEHKCYSQVLPNVGKFCSNNISDFIYADPPYVPENVSSFVGYTKDSFDLKNHKILFDFLKNGINFLLSNSNVDLVKNSFLPEYYQTCVISCKRTINSKNPTAKTNEVLIKPIWQ